MQSAQHVSGVEPAHLQEH